MRVTVRVFARLREVAGQSEWMCDVPSGASVTDVWAAAANTHPSLAPFESAVSCAVNAQFARKHTVLHEGDEVAFLPPVSGG